MNTIKETALSSFSEKGSTFMGFLYPIEHFQKELIALKAQHPKAVHFVTSSRFLNAHQQIEESFSDDGEPKGSSGMPTLKVLRGYELINVGFVSVRYFGGTLLGIGGLVRAYSKSAKDTILQAHLIPHKEEAQEVLEIPFSKTKQAFYLAKKFAISLNKQEHLLQGICVLCQGEKESIELFKNTLFDQKK